MSSFLESIMWKSISHSIRGFRQKKHIAELARVCHEISDDEISSNSSTDEGLECPICWESFNIVENVPYVLWCGHSLCKKCVLGLRLATLKFSAHQIQIPFFVSCPWCDLLTFRLLYKGNLRFPSKNFFILWMVESKNGERVKALYSICRDRQQIWPQRCPSATRNNSSDATNRGVHRLGHPSYINNHSRYSDRFTSERLQMSFHKSLDFFIRVMVKFPLVILLMIVTFAFTCECCYPNALLGNNNSLCGSSLLGSVFCISRAGLAGTRDENLEPYSSIKLLLFNSLIDWNLVVGQDMLYMELKLFPVDDENVE